MQEPKSENITRQETRVTRAERERLLGQRGVTLWFTGLSASGKSTIAHLVGPELDNVLPVEENLSLGDLVRRVAHQRVRERALPGAVRPHDGVHLVRVDGQVDAPDDFGTVLEGDVEVSDL